MDAGELTASMKVRRSFVGTRYADLLDAFYAGSVEAI